MVNYYSKEAFLFKSWLDIKSIQTHGVVLIKLIAGPKMFSDHSITILTLKRCSSANSADVFKNSLSRATSPLLCCK